MSLTPKKRYNTSALCMEEALKTENNHVCNDTILQIEEDNHDTHLSYKHNQDVKEDINHYNLQNSFCQEISNCIISIFSYIKELIKCILSNVNININIDKINILNINN